MSLAVAAAIDRVGAARPRGRVGHAAAVVLVGATIVLAELLLMEFDHGTHLLLGLLLVAGSALLFGPGPAFSGMVLGAGASIAIGGALVEGLLDRPHTYVQVVLYLMAGGAMIGLAWLVFHARTSEHARRSEVAAGPPRTEPGPTTLTEPLTERETEILRLAASGIAVDEIASRLFLSPNTVKTHLTHTYAKLGVRGRPDAIRAGLHFGCLSPADICPHRFPTEQAEPPVPVTRNRP